VRKGQKTKGNLAYRVVNIYPELTLEERENAKKEIARKVYNVIVKKIF